MSYPNYPGYPQQGTGYPPTYPPQQNSGQYPGYPPAPGFAANALPGSSSSPYPSASYPGITQATPYPVSPAYPAQNPSYPPGNSVYPATTPGYPATNPGYPGTAPSYPGSAPTHPGTAPSYPGSAPNYPGSAPNYPGSTPSYPGAAPSYPPANPGYPGATPGYPASTPSYGGAVPSSCPVNASSGPFQGPGFPGQSYGGVGVLPTTTATMEPKVPSVLPATPFDPRADAERLYKAMKGLGTDEMGLVNILCRRTSIQRTQIANAFKSSYGKDLVSKLKSELSGNLERVMASLATPMAEYLAKELHDAVDGLGTNEGTLVEILGSRSNHEIHEINAAYQRLYNRTLEKDVKGDTSGDFKRILVALMQGYREDNPVVNAAQARDDAQRLYHAGEGRLGTDESSFISILASRSYPHIRQVMAEYEQLKGNTLERAVKAEFSGYTERAMLTILQCAQSTSAYFAHRLHQALAGAGTNDRTLIRVLVSRCDIDLGSIKQAYERAYGRSLQAAVSSDTSGDYKKALLALIG